jgi:hypothetical protein
MSGWWLSGKNTLCCAVKAAGVHSRLLRGAFSKVACDDPAPATFEQGSKQINK